MMKKIIVLFFALATFGCTQKKQRLLGETEFQLKINSEYKDATTSPLKEKDRVKFKGLEFFKVDTSFVVTAILKRTPGTPFFEMKTTTDRVTLQRIFGVLSFKLRGEECKINVYQGKELMSNDQYNDHLFLPFLDDTNGESTYGGGRYIDLRIPEDDAIEIDFNKAYNPYCAYNGKYSCPIVPSDNYLSVMVEAGVKSFYKDH